MHICEIRPKTNRENGYTNTRLDTNQEFLKHISNNSEQKLFEKSHMVQAKIISTNFFVF